jgi:hypothetical protein
VMREQGRVIVGQALPWSHGQARHQTGAIILEDPKPALIAPEDGKLAIAFAGIREPADAVRFASRYGLLTQCVQTTDAQENRDWEPFSEWMRVVTTISEVIDLSVALRAFEGGDPRPLEGVADSPIMRAGWSEEPLTMRHDHPDKLKWPSGFPLDVQAREAILGLTTRGLEGLPLGLTRGHSPGRRGYAALFTGAVFPRTLQQVIFFDLWLLLTSPQEVRLCQQCGKPFIIHDRRQQYCTEACANHARYQRRKQQQKCPAVSL